MKLRNQSCQLILGHYKLPIGLFLLTSVSLFHREMKPFLSRAQTFFLVIKNLAGKPALVRSGLACLKKSIPRSAKKRRKPSQVERRKRPEEARNCTKGMQSFG